MANKGKTKGLWNGRSRRRNHWDRRRRYTGKLKPARDQGVHDELMERGGARAADLLARWRTGDE